MKLTFWFISSLLVFTLQVQSIETVPPSSEIDLSERISTGEHIEDFYWYTYVNIYKVKVSDESVDCMVCGYEVEGVGISNYPKYLFRHCIIYLINRSSESITYIPSSVSSPLISNIGNTQNCAIIDGTLIRLSNASGRTFPKDGEDFCFYFELERLAKHETLIGGLIKLMKVSSDGHDYRFNYSVNIWQQNGLTAGNGTLAWSANLQDDYGSYDSRGFYGLPGVSKLCFTQNGKFLIFNMASGGAIVDGHIPLKHYSYLLDVETHTFLPANSDVAFTSDEKYYVTERDGLPSLVDAETHDVLMRYDPGSTMTACGFSPDDARLYIACEDLKVYEFSSHVPDTAVEDWAVFE